jgi:hypothetical protein
VGLNVRRTFAVIAGTIAAFVTGEPVAFLTVVALAYVSEELPRLAY